MPLLTDLPDVAQVLVDKAVAVKDVFKLHSVFYGDQTKLPGTPVVCIEPGTKMSDLKNAMRGVDIEFTIYILIYSSLVTSGETNRKQSDELAAALEKMYNSDPQLLSAQGENRLIHCYIESVESGYSQKDNGPVRSSRLTFKGRSTDRLPSSS